MHIGKKESGSGTPEQDSPRRTHMDKAKFSYVNDQSRNNLEISKCFTDREHVISLELDKIKTKYKIQRGGESKGKKIDQKGKILRNQNIHQ